MSDSQLPDGVFAASVTPLHRTGAPDADALAAHATWLLDHGCDGVLLFGTTGEGLSFTVRERIDALDAVLDAGLPPERLLVGTSALPPPDAVRLTQHATQQDVGGVLVLPPFHFRDVSERGVEGFFSYLIDGVDDDRLRLYLYHYPQLTGVGIGFATIQRLVDAYPGQIAGLKDSGGEWDHMDALCDDFPDLQIFAGTEHFLLPVLEADGAGCISATANLTAPLAARVRDAHALGADASALQDDLTSMRSALSAFSFVPALKQVLAWRHDDPAWTRVRPPVATLPDDDRAALRTVMQRLEQTVGTLPESR